MIASEHPLIGVSSNLLLVFIVRIDAFSKSIDMCIDFWLLRNERSSIEIIIEKEKWQEQKNMIVIRQLNPP
jgi:hypothetical protein